MEGSRVAKRRGNILFEWLGGLSAVLAFLPQVALDGL